MAVNAIQKQVEFYFSDSNYRKDVFLRSVADSDPGGFVAISVLLTFNKLKTLSTDPEEIAAALSESKVVELSEDKASVRRIKSLPDEDTSKACTLYVKGFPINDPDVTIEAVAEEFGKFGEVKFVRFKKDPHTRAFQGSAFIEFGDPASVELACKSAYEEDRTTVKLTYKGNPYACVLPLTEWLQKKKAKLQSIKQTASEKDIKKRKRPEEAVDEVKFNPGCVIKVTNLPDDATPLTIKESFKTVGKVEFVDYLDENSYALVRFAEAADAKAALTVVAEGFKIAEKDEKTLEATMLEGDEESSYWNKVSKRFKSFNKKKGNKWNMKRKR